MERIEDFHNYALYTSTFTFTHTQLATSEQRDAGFYVAKNLTLSEKVVRSAEMTLPERGAWLG